MNKKPQKIQFESPNSKYIGKYQIIKKIGEGSYAKIYKVKKDSSETAYVLKNIQVSEEDYSSMKEILNESSILSACDNVYVVKYYDSFFFNGTFNIITEFCPYGDLFGYIKFYKVRGSKIEEKIIWIIFIQLSLGLNYLHQKKILHRDIKTKNIFIKNNLTVKIGDFGIAKILNSTSSYAHTFIGTPYYISPELCKDQPYNDKSDVWSLGCVLYELCTLNHPFEGGTQVEIYEKIMTQKFKAISPEYSQELKKMVDLLLEKDEKKRPKMKDILKMKCVIERANKYNIIIDLNENDTIDEEKIDANKYTNKISLKNNSYNINKKYEKSPNNYSNKSKKTKKEYENREIKSNKIKIDNIIKNNHIKKNINNSKNKSSLNKQMKNRILINSNVIQVEEGQINNNNIKQYKEIINLDKLNNNNKIKFSLPSNELNNNNKVIILKENKLKIKAKKTVTNAHPQKIIHKISNDLSLSYNTGNNSNNNSKNIINDYMSENLPQKISSNYYYHKKDAILKKQQQQQNLKQIINKKEFDNINNNQELISKTKTTNCNTNNNIMINNNIIDSDDISDEKEIIKENENYLSDENDNEINIKNENGLKVESKVPKKKYLLSSLKSENKSFKNLKEFTLEKIPTQKLNNSFTLEQNKENVKIYIEGNNSLNNKSNNEVISENIKLQKLKEEISKKIKKNENEMKSISYGIYQHVINLYKTIESDNIAELTNNLNQYLKQNLIIKGNKESEYLYKTFKKSFINYVLCEIELKNIENQIEQRKIGGKWFLSQTQHNDGEQKDKGDNNINIMK